MPRRLVRDNGVTRLYEVTDAQGAVIGTDEEQIPTPEQVNESTLRSRAQDALTANATYLAIASPSAAQVTAQVRRLTQECNGLIRLLLGALDSTDGTT